MRKTILCVLICCVPAVGIAQFILDQKHPTYYSAISSRLMDSISLKQPRFLALDARLHQLDNSISAAFQKERSIMRYDLKPLPTEPTVILGDLNLFEMRYRRYNVAYYEALKNTAYMQIVNPFTLYKPL